MLLDGWIIQSVDWTASITDCKGKKVPSKNAEPKYWEGWEVRSGKVYVGDSNILHASDTFRSLDEGKNRKGTITVTGLVGFEPNYNLTRPPWGKVKSAGDLPARTTDPGVPKHGQAHTLVIEFNCCCNPPTSSAKGTP